MKIITARVMENGIEKRKIVVLEDRVCVVCGSTFTPNKQATTYCSRKCGKKFNASKPEALEKARQRAREWYKSNHDEARAKRKAAYWRNPEKWRTKSKEYWDAHREEKRSKDQQYKDTTRHGSMREKLIEQHGCICSSCGQEFPPNRLAAHHVTFDKTQHDDQVLLCKPCHAKIHNLGQKRRKEITKEEIISAINSSKNLEEASNILGIQRCTLYKKRKEYGLLE